MGGANFHVVELEKIIETSARDVLQRETNSTSRVANFPTSIAVFDLLSYVALDSWPGMSFLTSLQYLCEALMALFVLCILQDLLLVQLWHCDHARSRVQSLLFLRVTNAKDVVFVQNFFPSSWQTLARPAETKILEAFRCSLTS